MSLLERNEAASVKVEGPCSGSSERPLVHISPPAAVATLLVLGALIHGGVLRNGFTSWDDDIYVTRNALIRDGSLAGALRLFTSFSNCNYHPLTYLTYTAEYALVGLKPWLYHLDNLLLHLAASVLAFELGRRWLKNNAAAFVSAFLFLAHPTRVESVAWVAERKDVLCAFFYLASLIAYADHLDSRKGARYALSLLLFLLALLSKAMAVTLPAALLFSLVGRKAVTSRRALELVPFFGLGVTFAIIGFLAQSSSGAVKELHGATWLHHALTIPKALAFYFSKLVLPICLSPRYLLEPAQGFLDPRCLAGSALALLGAVAARQSLKRRGILFLGLSFFAVTWAPVSGIIPSSTIAADRYLYLPALGLFFPLSAQLCTARKAFGPEHPLAPALRGAVFPVTSLLILASLFLTPLRVRVWRDGESLWTDALQENPRNPFAFNQLSIHYLECGRWGDAAASTLEAARLGLRAPEQVFNLCLAYRGLGDGERELSTAKGILGGAPHFVPAWLVVLRHLRERGDLEECEKRLDDLMSAFPDDPGLLAARGDLEEARGRHEQAFLCYLRSIELRQGDREVLLSASALLSLLGEGERALDLAERTIAMPGGVLPPGAREALLRMKKGIEGSGREDWARRWLALMNKAR